MEKIGRYQVVGELGRGAMGVVYRAIDPNIGRTVALKTMRLDVEGIEQDEMVRRFRNEARAAGLMSHPNIVTIHDADEYGHLFYIAMEYLEGETLRSLMTRKGVFSAEEILALAKQVAAGLDYAHQMKVVHRDIKPANIMITRLSVAKIMDFGISKSVGTMTRTGQVLGTPYYMSPEQVMGRELDGRADLFSFGVVLYEMATGVRPFTAENVTTIIYKIINESPIPACELQISVHPGLSAVIARCLAKNPNERYQSGAQLAADLENFKFLRPADEQATVVLPTRTESSQTHVEGPATASATVLKTAALETAAATTWKVAKEPTRVATSSSAVQRTDTDGKKVVKRLAWIATALLVVVFLGALRQAQRHKEAAQNRIVAQTREAFRKPAQERPPQVSKQDAEVRMAEVALNSASATAPHASTSEKGQTASVRNRASIRLTSNPEGALVRFDGRSSPSWTTPFTLADIAPGTHNFVFTKDGYSSEKRELEVGPKNSSYNLDLVPETTAISVSSDPPGAGIEIDGADTGKITPAQIPVAEGQHTVVLRLPGYRQAQAKLEIEKGQIYNLPQRLASLMQQTAEASNTPAQLTIPAGMGVVDFVTVPPGASIFIEGRRANATTPAHNAFPPGDYSVELRITGYKPLQRMIHVEEGKSSTIRELLDPQ